ncbi:hypothetical protein EG68_04797 [Paragonimus skrjabini miyazakii]|uniref:Uncharacterized protein n=1 Tax=Paragonimus skrjabini miyazakii TaxID=59628 RepID=A0A8S9YU70_9TREM|nr:hypothetical protein EG68_04797 [Paragonimus skrjabini miyazakii]
MKCTTLALCILNIIFVSELQADECTNQIQQDMYSCVDENASKCDISPSLADLEKNQQCLRCPDCLTARNTCLLSKLADKKYERCNEVKMYISTLTRRQRAQ